jgi:hypothetical protein
MKMDFDSILYIVITIVILVISALGSRRKKRAQQVQGPGATQDIRSTDSRDDQPYGTEEEEPAPPRQEPAWEQAINPLGRLEKILSGQISGFENLEGESMEVTVDEEEQILEDIRRSRMEEEAEEVEIETEPEPEPELQSPSPQHTIKRGKGDLLELFKDPDDIKKAIIYNEILKRKDW